MTQDTINIYRKFMFASSVRTILGRVTSLLYVYFISRLISDALYDIIIILAGIQISLSKLSVFGMKYSAVHFAKNDGVIREQSIALPIKMSAFVSVPFFLIFWEGTLSIVMNLGLAGRLEILGENTVARVFYDLSLLLAMFSEAVKVNLYADLKADQVAWFDLINSVNVSIFVPIFYFFFKSFESVFIAWTLIYLIPVIAWVKTSYKSFRTSINRDLAIQILRYGSPLFLLAIINIVGEYMSTFIIFFSLPEGNTTLYYWVLRFNQLAITSLLMFTTGIFPLLLQKLKEGGDVAVKRINEIYLRLASYAIILGYGILLIGAKLLLTVVLPSRFITGLELYYAITLGFILQSYSTIVHPQIEAFGPRRWIVILTVSSSLLSMVLPFFMLNFGLLGIGSVIFIVHLVKNAMQILIFRKLKISLRRFMVKQIVIAILISMLLTILSYTIDNLLLTALLTLVFALVSYPLARRLGMIRNDELEILYRVIPDKYHNFVRKFLR